MPSEDLDKAIKLIKSGQIEEAQGLLGELIKSDPHNVIAWFWYIETLPKTKIRIDVLKVCQIYNPDDPRIQQALKTLEINQNRDNQTQSINQLAQSQIPPSDSQKISLDKDESIQVQTKTTSKLKPWYSIKKVYLLTFVFLILVFSVLGLIIKTQSFRSAQTTAVPPHILNDVSMDKDKYGSVRLFIVADKSLSERDAQILINYYKQQYSSANVLQIDIHCDAVYAQAKYVTSDSPIPESKYYSHLIYWYISGAFDTSLHSFKDQPDYMGTACK